MGRKKSAKGYTITSHGYILIWKPEHHLADIRGYAYEHRIVMEQKIGRNLLPGELIHHIDENKQNNNPNNLELFTSVGLHFSHHNRGRDSKQRLAGEENKIIECICGCGAQFKKYDQLGRPRRYVSGHNSRNRNG